MILELRSHALRTGMTVGVEMILASKRLVLRAAIRTRKVTVNITNIWRKVLLVIIVVTDDGTGARSVLAHRRCQVESH